MRCGDELPLQFQDGTCSCVDISIYVCRDHKSYAKYSAVDSEIDQKVCQDLISGDSVILKGKKAMFEDLISEQRAILDSEEVCVYYFFVLTLPYIMSRLQSFF